MEKRIINPWHWQEQQGWSWAVETNNAQRVLYCAGQVSVDANGRPVHAGDMRAQIKLALDNLETVLHQAGYGLSDVVRLDYYTTDADQLMANWDVIRGRFEPTGQQAGGVLLGVSRLAVPELLIEIEAIAAK